MNPIHIVALVCSTWLSVLVVGQEVDVTAARASHGVQATPDGAWAGGRDYSARFDARGVEFTPALGRAAARPFPVRFTMASVRRGANDVFVTTGDVAPVVAGDEVRYVHGSDLTEVYHVRAEGIEQSFVFATKPAGTGDLVVRGAITTELPNAAASDDGVRYERDGLGGVTFGGVTGIDANGATARGSIRVIDGGAHVEWVLPAAFVDHARYPLVLDPLIGSVIAIGDASGADQRPSVAFDESTARYLVVWAVALGGSIGELRGQLVSSGGTVAGGILLLSGVAGAETSRRPSVVSVNASDRFFVAWVGGGFAFHGVGVSGASGSLSGIVSFGGGGTLAAGGDLRPVGDKCLVAYGASGAISCRLIHVPAFGALSVGSEVFLTTGAGVAHMTMSKTAGLAGRWLLAWAANTVISGGPYADVRCVVVNEVGASCSPVTTLATSVGGDVANLTCAQRDGDRFVVGWQDNVTGRVRVRPLTLSGLCPATIILGTTVEPSSAPGTQTWPALDFAKHKYVLAWTQTPPAGVAQVFVKGLDPEVCTSCGLEWAMDALPGTQEQPAVASRWSGGGAGSASDEAVVVWSNGTIRGRRFEARSNDMVIAMGGACSLTGLNDFATYNGDAVLGATDFELVLANPVSLPLILVLGFGSLSAPCGSCTIVPTLDILLPPTNPYPLTIPCDPLLVGVDLYTQWVLLKPSDCPLLPDLAFSNSLRFTIGE